ncbi:MAG: DUF3299 domain-containing protein [Planctomycetes bacterium]|nr:DUF3299 domain-containing protein [Planctomycetota bacterium]
MKQTTFPLALVISAGLIGTALVISSFAAPGADEKPAKRGDKVEEITFDDLTTKMDPDVKWEPKYLTERIEELDGKTVRIPGFMYPDFKTKGITQFVMLKNTECLFGPGGTAHCVMMVHMSPGESTRYTTRPLSLEGVLLLKPWNGPDGNTWALYELRDAVVK